ncbi:hypothetical protein C8F04DRAFT_1178326 [Mycena alexandri]|uniref:Uncharacterized protein n=1 Tax=Mycena alexandri TaxID=1745969 RepID=A0AAD6T5Z5_9AGAR|nr:hypothetical protein C8F04DRAFT_1178326 [Mycena alexandri]
MSDRTPFFTDFGLSHVQDPEYSQGSTSCTGLEALPPQNKLSRVCRHRGSVLRCLADSLLPLNYHLIYNFTHFLSFWFPSLPTSLYYGSSLFCLCSPPNLDDPSTDEESVREPTPPPRPKPKAKSWCHPFNPECMTIIDGVVYQDRTSDRHLSMDPFIHLRAPELQQLIQLLADPNELNKCLKRPSRVLKLIERSRLRFGLSIVVGTPTWFTSTTPLRHIYDEIDPALKPQYERFQRLLINKNKQFENSAFGPDWVMPDATKYFERIGTATDEDHVHRPHRVLSGCPFVLSWTNFGAYSSLTVLVLHDLFGTMAPAVTVLVAVLSASPILCSISLRHVHCILAGEADTPTFIHLPGVTNFDVRFDSNAGLAFVVQCLVMPVTKLSVTFDSAQDVVVLFDALAACRGNTVPIMQTLSLSRLPLADVVAYMEGRDWTQTKLEILRVHSLGDRGEEPTLDESGRT